MFLPKDIVIIKWIGFTSLIFIGVYLVSVKIIFKYEIMVAEKAQARVEAALAARPSDPAEGFFANPPIEPFGPPEEE